MNRTLAASSPSSPAVGAARRDRLASNRRFGQPPSSRSGGPSCWTTALPPRHRHWRRAAACRGRRLRSSATQQLGRLDASAGAIVAMIRWPTSRPKSGPTSSSTKRPTAASCTSRPRAPSAELLFLEVPTEGTGSGSVLDKSGPHPDELSRRRRGAGNPRHARTTARPTTASSSATIRRTTWPCSKINAPPRDARCRSSSAIRRGCKVGQIVYAIGNPFGLERTMTTGIITSLNRSLPSEEPAGR